MSDLGLTIFQTECNTDIRPDDTTGELWSAWAYAGAVTCPSFWARSLSGWRPNYGFYAQWRNFPVMGSPVETDKIRV